MSVNNIEMIEVGFQPDFIPLSNGVMYQMESTLLMIQSKANWQ